MNIKCGTDIIEIDRIENAINKNSNFLKTVFTDNEIEYCEAHKIQKYQHYAVRFAAKEAIFKAISSELKEKYEVSWKDLEIDVVFECTGLFTSDEKAMAHINAGAKHVIISAPAKGDIKTIVYNVNHNILTGDEKIISAASCTTNCLAPVVDVLDKEIGIVKGYMTTVHAYTNDQASLDIAHKKGHLARRGRACAANIVPASTGAASAIGLVCPNLAGKLDGTAMRVPVPTGSVVDLTLELKRNTTKEEINAILKSNTNETLEYTEDPIVSSDVIGRRCGSLVDALSTNVLEVDGRQLVKVVSWYDNEMSYTAQMVRTAKYLMSM